MKILFTLFVATATGFAAQVAMAETLISDTINDGSFRSDLAADGITPLGDNEDSNFWAISETGSDFESLDRVLGPGGNPDTQDGDDGSYVQNRDSVRTLTSNTITLSSALILGEAFDFSIWAGAASNTSSFTWSAVLQFDVGSDVSLGNGVVDGSVDTDWVNFFTTGIPNADNIGATAVTLEITADNVERDPGGTQSQSYLDNILLTRSFQGVPGDVNGDTDVNTTDFNTIKNNFFQSFADRTDGDLVDDDFIDFADYGQWKQAPKDPDLVAAGSSVPEPTTAVTLMAGLVCLAMARRRAGSLK